MPCLPPALALLGLALLGLAGCGLGPGAKIDQPVLRGPDVERLVRGQTFAGETVAGAPVEIYFREDGTVFMRGRSPAGVPFQDHGRWWVQSDRLCTRYEKVRGRQSVCEWVTQQGADIRIYEPGGDPSARGRFYAATPAGIGRLPAAPPRSGG